MIKTRIVIRHILTYALLVAGSLPAWSAQDIVYSARYYFPPGSTGTSHFHIYRIDPDGSHKIQLTSGSSDDAMAKWSPNGKLIAFVRDSDSTTNFTQTIMVMTSTGSNEHAVATYKDFDGFTWSRDSTKLLADYTIYTKKPGANQYDPMNSRPMTETLDLTGKVLSKLPQSDDMTSPDGSHTYVPNETSTSGAITDASNKTTGTTSISYSGIYWINNKEFLGVSSIDDTNGGPTVYQVDLVSIDGTIVSYGKLKESGGLGKPDENVYYGADITQVDPWPGKPNTYLAWENWQNSTVGTDYGLYYLDPVNKTMKFVAESQFAAWSPDHRYICTSPGKDLANYKKKPDGTYSMVFTAALNITDATTFKTKTIQGGLVLVVDADWR
jgi:hypothetical protein